MLCGVVVWCCGVVCCGVWCRVEWHGGKTLLSEAPGQEAGKCATFGCFGRLPPGRLASAQLSVDSHMHNFWAGACV